MKEFMKYIKDNEKRPLFLSKSLFLFWLYYFPQFFTSASADFHKQRCKDFLEDKHLMLVAFRESAKTVWTMIYLIYGICYKKFNYCLFYSYEIKLSSRRLFDIIVQLKTNKRLIQDFWQLFPNVDTKKDDGLQKKSIGEFITTNGVKFQAMSMNMSSRWHLYINKLWAFRPDILVFDDVDVIDSVRNPEIVNKNIEFMEWEVFGGLDSQAKIIFLWNIITTQWVVPYMQDKISNDDKWILRKKSIIENWQITRDRFVHTDKEQEEWKAKGEIKISLETKERDQKEQYKPNFLLIPSVKLWNPVFDLDKISELPIIPYTLDTRYKELRIYKEPQETIYWIDVCWGGEWDYGSIVGRNRNKELVLSFRGKYAPDQLGDVIEYLFHKGYKGKLIPENNSIGVALIDKLKNGICERYIHSETALDKITQRPTNKYWFSTNSKTKPLVISDLEEALRKWTITEFDERSKEDMYTYYYDEKWATNALKGYYDDMVIWEALCLFWLKQWLPVRFI